MMVCISVPEHLLEDYDMKNPNHCGIPVRGGGGTGLRDSLVEEDNISGHNWTTS